MNIEYRMRHNATVVRNTRTIHVISLAQGSCLSPLRVSLVLSQVYELLSVMRARVLHV